MNYVLLFVLLFFIAITSMIEFEREEKEKKEPKKVLVTEKKIEKNPVKKVRISTKKKKFYSLLVPAVDEAHNKLMQEYIQVAKDINESVNLQKVKELKQAYKVSSDDELLLALKPHPQSIVLAQAAMESAWGTSRFFKEANNVFGMWSAKSSEPRIAAGEQRDGNRTIWLRKFDTVEESIEAYYRLIATAKAYKELREIRYHTDNPYEIVKKLDKYSELGEKYTVELAKVIKYNDLTKYDTNASLANH